MAEALESSATISKPIGVVGAALFRDGKLLTVRRSMSMKLPGLWEFPGGKIEEGETETEALSRELSEELQIGVEPLTHLISTEFEYDFGSVLLSVYAGRLNGPDPFLVQHSELRWLTKAEVFDVDWAPADIPVVHALLQRGRL